MERPTPMRPYLEIIADLKHEYPSIAQALDQAGRARARQLTTQGIDARLRRLESLLQVLTASARIWQLRHAAIGRLILRARNDFTVGLEAAISGQVAVTANAMRDVMELELLLRDFTLDWLKVDEWFLKDDRFRRKTFAPVEVRKRLSAAIGVSPDQLPDKTDYDAHSMLLHVNPVDLDMLEGGFELRVRIAATQLALAEVFQHGARFARAIVGLDKARSYGESITNADDIEHGLLEGFDLCARARTAAEVIEKRIVDETGVDRAFLLEGGMILTVDRSRGTGQLTAIQYQSIDEIIGLIDREGSVHLEILSEGK